ncbi:hypothetical protein HOO68_01370 [Candidatus Gracilibacteria bacterium]|nr:hypothetical protein [Candidatus Gracilibacteria bacterium]
MYSIIVQIHPRIYKEKGPSENGGGSFSEEKKETAEEELIRKEWFDNMIDIIGSKTNRDDALVIMNALMDGDFKGKWKEDLQVLNYHIRSLFDHDGEKKENFMARIADIKKAFGIKTMENISENKMKKFEEFKNNNPIDTYKQEILTFIIKHPHKADGSALLGKNLLDKKRKELDGLDIGAMNEYEAVLITAEDIVNDPTFADNTGGVDKFISWKKTKLQMEIFEKYITDAINTAAETKKPQNIEGFGKQEFQNITLDEERVLIERSPDKLYDDYMKGLEGLLKENRLTKELANIYIDGLSGGILPILEKLGPNHPLKKTYENKIVQMRALAENDILYNNFGVLTGFFNGKSLKNFFIEAEKGKGIDGSIGYDKNGTFKFYSVNEMGEAIMNTGEISGTYDTAWDSYIKGSKGNYSELDEIFGEKSLEALSIYLANRGYKSSLIDNNPGFVDYIKGKLPNDLIVGQESLNSKIEELTIEKDFSNLQQVIKEKGFKMPEKLPRTTDGAIDSAALIFYVIEGNATPGNVQLIKAALKEDFKNIRTGAQQKKTELIESLGEFKDWTKALSYLGIKNPLEGNISITGSTKESLPAQQRNILRTQLTSEHSRLLQAKKTKENNDKIELINKLLPLIAVEKDDTDAHIAEIVIDQLDDTNTADASGDKDKEAAIKKSTQANAEAVVEQEQNDEFAKRNAEIIEKLSIEHQLPLDNTELANPQYLNQINGLIGELTSKKTPLTQEESVFLDYLQRTKEQIKLNSQSVLAYKELEGSYPEFKETLSNIKKTNEEVYEDITPQKIAQYEHIATYIFPKDPVSEMTKDLANMPPGGELSLVKYYSNSDIGNGMRSSISIEDCSFTKNGVNSGTVNFPAYMGIPPMKGVPVKGIESFLSQADLFMRLGFQSLIPAMSDINQEISKKYGKGTSSLDGSFDSYELRRVSNILCKIIGIDLTGNEAIPDITNKINAKYSSDGDIRKRLKEMEILTEEGGFRKFAFQEIVQNMDDKSI